MAPRGDEEEEPLTQRVTRSSPKKQANKKKQAPKKIVASLATPAAEVTPPEVHFLLLLLQKGSILLPLGFWVGFGQHLF